MCQYYAHAFPCKHTSYSFARFCRAANMIQTPCAERQVWHTLRMDEACDNCKTWYPEKAAALYQDTRQHNRAALRGTRS